MSDKSPLTQDVQLSALLVMSGSFDSIRKTVRHLCSQSARKVLEIVIITTNPKLVETSALESAGAWQIVRVDQLPTSASGWAAGIRQARAPVVVLCEDHSFPEPAWAQSLITAHQDRWSAVAPAVENGNPETLISWADFTLCFLDWFAPEKSGPVSSCPGHNTSYKLSVLREYDADLENWLNPERVLHLDLAAKGHTMLLTKDAVTHHVNISVARSYLGHSFLGGRIFGGSRAAQWSRGRAVLYAVAFPLVPFMRLRRILQHLDTTAKRKKARFWMALPWTGAGLLCHAMGEAAGYLAGSGNSGQRYMNYEARRIDYLIPREKHLLRV